MPNSQQTIVRAILEVMRAENRPMTVSEIYDAIIGSKLYRFKADRPVHVVRVQLRRHCLGIDLSKSSTTKYFGVNNGNYFLLVDQKYSDTKAPKVNGLYKNDTKPTTLNNLRSIHNQYLSEFRQRILKEVKGLDPQSFEIFCKNLLDVYGFHEVSVTRLSKDGGIDGFGKLKLGFSNLNVAFQCKKWIKGTIGRPQINQFRGDIQGQFELGLFFTTANFSADAENNSSKAGAVPIALFNGNAIVEIMLEKGLGVEKNYLEIFTFNLELATAENDQA